MISIFIYIFCCVSFIYSLVDFTNACQKLTLELSGPAPGFAFDLHVEDSQSPATESPGGPGKDFTEESLGEPLEVD